MNIKNAKTGIILMLIGFFSFGMFSCRKEAATVAIITIVDATGAVYPNATVRLYPEATINPYPLIIIDDEILSDNSGEALFDYTDKFNLGQAGFTVLTIQVNSEDNTLFGEGIINVEAEKTSYETVMIQPQ